MGSAALMAEAALGALYKAVRTRLLTNQTVWGTRVYADLAPPSASRPYCVYAWSSGGELNSLVRQDAEITLIVKCIADTMSDGMAGAELISGLLNDADLSSADALDGGDDWYILHVVQLQVVHMRELVDGRDVYHEGHRFSFRMEGK
jgi:hypothetical protein